MKGEELKILFSEQSPEIMEMGKRFFDGKGIKTYYCAKNGKEVIDAIDRIKPDVVFVDVFLSNIDAIGVKKACEEMASAPKLFFATGSYDNEKLTSQVLNAGYDYYFLKPFSYEVALDRIEHLLGTSVHKPQGESGDLEYKVSEILHVMGVPAHSRELNSQTGRVVAATRAFCADGAQPHSSTDNKAAIIILIYFMETLQFASK